MLEMTLAEMFEVLDYLLISKDEEAVASVLILLAIELSANDLLHAFNLPLKVCLFIFLNATAPASDTSADTNLSSDGTLFLVLVLHKLELVKQLLKLDTLFVQVVVITDDSGSNEDTLTRDWVRRVQLDHIG